MNNPENKSSSRETAENQRDIRSEIDAIMPTYLDYPQAAASLFPEAAAPLAKMEKANRKLHKVVLLDGKPPEPKDIRRHKDDPVENLAPHQRVLRGVQEWYQTLGSLNSLKGAENELLLGALRIFTNNDMNGPGAEFKINKSDIPGSFRRFINEQTLQGQEHSEFLFIAGQLIHEASLVTDNDYWARDLRSLVTNIYSTIRQSEQIGWNSKQKRDASRFWCTMKFEGIRSRLNAHSNNEDEEKKWRPAYTTVQQMLIGDLKEIINSGSQLSNGELGEWMYLALAHDTVITVSAQEAVSIRPAFLREDKPHDRIYDSTNIKKHAFDMVLNKHLIQVKTKVEIGNDYISQIKLYGVAEDKVRAKKEELNKEDKPAVEVLSKINAFLHGEMLKNLAAVMYKYRLIEVPKSQEGIFANLQKQEKPIRELVLKERELALKERELALEGV